MRSGPDDARSAMLAPRRASGGMPDRGGGGEGVCVCVCDREHHTRRIQYMAGDERDDGTTQCEPETQHFPSPFMFGSTWRLEQGLFLLSGIFHFFYLPPPPASLSLFTRTSNSALFLNITSFLSTEKTL